MKVEEFWKCTYQEYWLYALRLFKESEKEKSELDLRFFLTGHLEAAFASVMVKKKDGTNWIWKDFIRLPSEVDKEEILPKLSLKKAKQLLGSKFRMN